ncbi:hypothetical protein DOY81_003292 [Sarcophaga bullata]|nr:hypothetical protein DOY81_003292 [Sarcophaga bullata]
MRPKRKKANKNKTDKNFNIKHTFQKVEFILTQRSKLRVKKKLK